MALNAMFSLSCPSCGADVPVYSATSALVVCEYCHSTLIRSGDGAVDSGKKSALIEDFSPLQLYSSGVFHGENFTVIGRLQIHYNRGCWNEWYVLFDSGKYGWLADFSGQYVLTQEQQPVTAPCPFNKLKAGTTRVKFNNVYYIAADVRHATSVKANAQGELPFTLEKDEVVLSADFRYRNDFLTLDYSENEQYPVLYAGKEVKLGDLRCQNLRSDDQVQQTAGKLKGQRTSFSCPNCGAPLAWYPGVAQNVICPSCHSDIDLSEGKAQVMRTVQMRKAQESDITLKLGEVAKIGGARWTVIGFVRVLEIPPEDALRYVDGNTKSTSFGSDYWYEYLLYHPSKGFIWLVESENGWDLSHTTDTWPDLDIKSKPYVNNKALPPLYDYGGRVVYAVGAFYWHIEPDDITYYQDYRYNQGKLCAERTADELSWSVSRPITADELATWFERPELAQSVKSQAAAPVGKSAALLLLITFFFINVPAIMASLTSGSFEFVFIVCFIVYWIIWHPYKTVDDDDD